MVLRKSSSREDLSLGRHGMSKGVGGGEDLEPEAHCPSNKRAYFPV